ncbi:daunorubicin resistance protein DrrA family ABC transporter ATP-binding protein [Arthrobacter rhombi]|uniref:ATP-binding cassette domain-containing protein n=1 Tax=Arthrobacter rhombi TaxID=71253 RepID=UPI0031DE6497
MIRLEAVTQAYGSFRALDGLSLSAGPGEVLGLLGPNGSGKTTAVKVISTLLTPNSGVVTVNGHNAATAPDAVRRSIGLSGQYAAVDEKLTGYENLHMVGRLYGLSRRDAATRARELLEHFRLEAVAGKRAGQYSGGMRRRLDLAGALVARPPVVILDEPTTGLDPRGRMDTWSAVRSLSADGTCVLLTTQYLEEADQLADNIAVLDAGRVIAEGTAQELKDRAGSARIDVVTANSTDGERAARVLERASGNTEPAVVDAGGNRLGVPAPRGEATLAAALAELAAAGIPVAEISLRRPTLDDVFLRLTGASASSAAPADPADGDDDTSADHHTPLPVGVAVGGRGRQEVGS